ncbi:DUF5994 family protein [Streptomyces coelicoflavus]|uniref:DUF5994 family protein n=2 Tax=Streptomyces TaxID=1883 RepID=UPI0036510BC4
MDEHRRNRYRQALTPIAAQQDLRRSTVVGRLKFLARRAESLSSPCAPQPALAGSQVGGGWYDLLTQLPEMLAALPSAWGDITGVIADAAAWSAAPGRMFVANQVVRLHRAPASPHAPERDALLSPGIGRRVLLVAPRTRPRKPPLSSWPPRWTTACPTTTEKSEARARRRRRDRADRWGPWARDPYPTVTGAATGTNRCKDGHTSPRGTAVHAPVPARTGAPCHPPADEEFRPP